MSLSQILIGVSAFLVLALFFMYKDRIKAAFSLGKKEEELSNMNAILKEVDRHKKQKERRDAEIKAMSDTELDNKLRRR